jgi:hypothetical protein
MNFMLKPCILKNQQWQLKKWIRHQYPFNFSKFFTHNKHILGMFLFIPFANFCDKKMGLWAMVCGFIARDFCNSNFSLD